MSGDASEWLASAMDRAKNLTPLAYRLRQYYRQEFSNWVAVNPVGDGKNDSGELGASISNVDGFSVTGDTITAGTAVPYAEYYSRYRNENGLAPLLPIDGETLPGAGSLVVEWILAGRT